MSWDSPAVITDGCGYGRREETSHYDQMASQITDGNVVFDAPYNNTCIIDRRE